LSFKIARDRRKQTLIEPVRYKQAPKAHKRRALGGFFVAGKAAKAPKARAVRKRLGERDVGKIIPGGKQQRLEHRQRRPGFFAHGGWVKPCQSPLRRRNVDQGSHEREVLNSQPFQRLRHIHQLALTYLVYPGATHKRFEHSLGVMELAGRVFDVVTNRDNTSDQIRDLLSPLKNEDELRYWRRVLRMAALCHDIGHLPFSHAAEKELLPSGWDREKLTREIICS